MRVGVSRGHDLWGLDILSKPEGNASEGTAQKESIQDRGDKPAGKGSRCSELVAEAPEEGIKEDVLDGERITMLGVKFATALSVADKDPVGGPIGSASEAILLDKSLQEKRAVGVALFPMGRKTLGDTSEDARCQIVRSDPGKDEEASIVDDEMKKTFTLLLVPANELITRSDFPGRGTEAESRQEVGTTDLIDAVRGAEHQVTQLSTWQGLVAQIVVAFDQLIPEEGVLLVFDETKG